MENEYVLFIEYQYADGIKLTHDFIVFETELNRIVPLLQKVIYAGGSLYPISHSRDIPRVPFEGKIPYRVLGYDFVEKSLFDEMNQAINDGF